MAGEWVRSGLALSLQIIAGFIGIGIVGIVIYGVFYPWGKKILTYYQNKSARDLASFTIYTRDQRLNAASIANVQKAINKEIITRWINARTIISITHSPHIEGHQFTVWYKEIPVMNKYTDPKSAEHYANNINMP
jgi:hypothetical protein